MAYNQDNTVYQHQIGFGTKVYKKVNLANAGNKPFGQKPVTLVTVKQPTGFHASKLNASNNFPTNYRGMLSSDGNKRLLSNPKNDGSLFSKTINRTAAICPKTSQKPSNRLTLTAKNRIPLRKQLKPPLEAQTIGQIKNNMAPKFQVRAGLAASTMASGALSNNFGYLRNRTTPLRRQTSKHNISTTPLNTTTPKTRTQAVKTVATPKITANQAAGDHSQTIQISRKEIPPVRLTAVVNITQSCNDELPTVGAVLTEVPTLFTSTVVGQNEEAAPFTPEETVKKSVVRKKFVVNSKPLSARMEERQKGGNENIRSRQRHPKSKSARAEEAEVTEEAPSENIVFSELGIQTNENEIINPSLLVGDSRYVSPSASVIAEIEKTRKEQKTKDLLNISRKFSETNQRQEQHIDELNEFLQQSYITKKPRKVRDMFEADRK